MPVACGDSGTQFSPIPAAGPTTVRDDVKRLVERLLSGKVATEPDWQLLADRRRSSRQLTLTDRSVSLARQGRRLTLTALCSEPPIGLNTPCRISRTVGCRTGPLPRSGDIYTGWQLPPRTGRPKERA